MLTIFDLHAFVAYNLSITGKQTREYSETISPTQQFTSLSANYVRGQCLSVMSAEVVSEKRMYLSR